MMKVRLLLLISALVLAALAGCRSAHTTSAILYIDEQNYQKAVDVIDEGLSYDPDDPEAYFWQGEAYSHMGEKAVQDNDYVKAEDSYAKAYEKYMIALRMNPERMSGQVYKSLDINYSNRKGDGDRMFQNGYYEQAEGYYRLAYVAMPDSTAPLREIANMKLNMAASAPADSAAVLMNEALKFLDKVLAAQPGEYQALVDKAYVLSYLKRLDDAGKIYEELLVTHGDDAKLLVDVAGFARARGDIAGAADLNVKIADLYQKDGDFSNDSEVVGLLTEAGNWYASRDVEQYEKALSALDRAGQIDVLSKDIMFYRLRTCFFFGRELEERADTAPEGEKQKLLDQAQEMYRRGVEVGTALTSYAADFADGYQFLALCQIETGDLAGGEVSNQKYKELTGS
jgi:tetratricopeptide (TPR) repeat protein